MTSTLFLDEILDLSYALTNSYGVSIVLLSVILNIFLSPFFWLSERLQNKERLRQEVMRKDLDVLKNIASKNEKYFYTLEVYKRYNYKPYYSLVGTISLLIQVPFFLAAYSLLMGNENLADTAFGFITNLGEPDRTIVIKSITFNLLPLAMTAINLLAVYLRYRLHKNKREVYQLTLISIVFLVLLYDLPSSLLIYWTTNNLFSVLGLALPKIGLFDKIYESIPKRIFRQSKKILLSFVCSVRAFKNEVVIILINFTLWFLMPLFIAGSFKEDLFEANVTNKFHLLLIISLVFIAITLSLFWFFRFILVKFVSNGSRNDINSRLFGLLIFIFSWVTLTGFVFPLIQSTGGMIDSNHLTLSVSWENFAISAFSSLLLSWLVVVKRKSKIIIAFFAVFFLTAIPQLLYSINSIKSASRQITVSDLSEEKNIIVVSFDGIQRSVVRDIVFNDSALYHEFKDFLFFENPTSNAPATVMSIAGELCGNLDFHKYGQTEEEVISNLPLDELIINSLSSDQINVSLFGEYTMFSSEPENNHYVDDPMHGKYRFYSLFDYVFDRIFSGRIGYRLSYRITRLFVDPLFVKLNLVGAGDFHDKAEIDEYSNWIKDLNTESKDTLSLKYFHFKHTHFPIRFDKNGIVHSEDSEWMASNQNEKGVYAQTHFALHQFVQLLRKLHSINAYNQTMIIFKSDHGQPTSYFPDYPLNMRINGHKSWGYSRYEPLLMIKDIDGNGDSIKSVEEFVTLNDISATIEECIYPNSCSSTSIKGVNLLDESIELSKSPYIYINFVSDSTSNFKFDTHETRKVDRSKVKNLLHLLEVENKGYEPTTF